MIGAMSRFDVAGAKAEGGTMFDVRRRKLVKLFGSVAATWPLATRAQRSKVAQIGALYLGVADGESFTKELREGMRQLGYVEGRTLHSRFALPRGGRNDFLNSRQN